MKATKSGISSAAAAATATSLACLTAITVAGYTLYVSRKKNGASADPSSDADEADEANEANTSTSRSILVPFEEESEPAAGAPVQQIDISALSESALTRIQTQDTITIAYASTTGTCKNFATSLYDTLTKLIQHSPGTTTTVQMCTVDELDWWDELLNNEDADADADDDADETTTQQNIALPPPLVIFILPTWTGGTLPEQHSALLTSLEEISHDWRVAPQPLRSNHQDPTGTGTGTGTGAAPKKGAHKHDAHTLQIACFGMGSSAYDNSTFCKPAKDVFKLFMKLGARSLLTSHGKSVVGTGDDDAGDCKAVFQEWMDRVVGRMEEVHSTGSAVSKEDATASASAGGCCKKSATKDDSGGCGCQEEKANDDAGGGCCSNEQDDGGGGCCSNDQDEEQEEYADDDDDDGFEDDDSAYESDYDNDEQKEPEVMDLEDIGNAMKSSSEQSSKNKKNKEPKAMVTPKQAAALKKEGYRIIGTHSAVKLCRWTKHQLRGRGGCYKHTFYGITSYQCMEATPSLACANKCKCCMISIPRYFVLGFASSLIHRTYVCILYIM